MLRGVRWLVANKFQAYIFTERNLSTTISVAMKAIQLFLVLLICASVAVECLQFSVDFGEKAFKKCKQVGRKVDRSKCSMLQDAIESYIDNMGVQLAEKMGFSLADVEKNAKQPAFITSGNRILDEMVQYVVDNPKATEKETTTYFGTKFFKWWIDLLKNEPAPEFPSNFNFDGKNLPEELRRQLKQKAAQQANSDAQAPRKSKPAKKPVVEDDEEMEEKIEL